MVKRGENDEKAQGTTCAHLFVEIGGIYAILYSECRSIIPPYNHLNTPKTAYIQKNGQFLHILTLFDDFLKWHKYGINDINRGL